MWQDYEPFVSIGVALAAGLLIGFEREQSQAKDCRRLAFWVGRGRFRCFRSSGRCRCC
jgi:uncharacterized membrane protein YhiD involved in acid resistance